ncbi:hypothetical protein CHELA1G11_10701 [Hyphomicrobiales bacterium]|nr:hypothetical protein CHELA1G11_10701 [Hyphomicrobiales bacterium]CAH1672835.1 hypothetical protein CHELA1G2_13603 [Hyphomicrobiales bacterium]
MQQFSDRLGSCFPCRLSLAVYIVDEIALANIILAKYFVGWSAAKLTVWAARRATQ